MLDIIYQKSKAIVGREGGFVNDPDDPGGATKYGVTIHTMIDLGLDLDKDGDVDVEDVKLLTVEDATRIFVDHYFYAPKIDQLPDILHETVFDMQVNAGANAIKILQRLVSDMGFDPRGIDGKIGPGTLRAVSMAASAAPGFIVDAYGIARRDYYFRIGDRRKKSRKYCVSRAGGKGGWIRRSEEFISPKYHLTDQQFQKRISSWA